MSLFYLAYVLSFSLGALLAIEVFEYIEKKTDKEETDDSQDITDIRMYLDPAYSDVFSTNDISDRS